MPGALAGSPCWKPLLEALAGSPCRNRLEIGRRPWLNERLDADFSRKPPVARQDVRPERASRHEPTAKSATGDAFQQAQRAISPDERKI